MSVSKKEPFKLTISYPEESRFPPYKDIKPFSDRKKPTFKFPWSDRKIYGEILDEVEQEEYVTWPNGTKKLYKHVLQLIHWNHDPKDRVEIRFGYYKTNLENDTPTTWILGQFAPTLEKRVFLRLMARVLAKWVYVFLIFLKNTLN